MGLTSRRAVGLAGRASQRTNRPTDRPTKPRTGRRSQTAIDTPARREEDRHDSRRRLDVEGCPLRRGMHSSVASNLKATPLILIRLLIPLLLHFVFLLLLLMLSLFLVSSFSSNSASSASSFYSPITILHHYCSNTRLLSYVFPLSPQPDYIRPPSRPILYPPTSHHSLSSPC